MSCTSDFTSLIILFRSPSPTPTPYPNPNYVDASTPEPLRIRRGGIWHLTRRPKRRSEFIHALLQRWCLFHDLSQAKASSFLQDTTQTFLQLPQNAPGISLSRDEFCYLRVLSEMKLRNGKNVPPTETTTSELFLDMEPSALTASPETPFTISSEHDTYVSISPLDKRSSISPSKVKKAKLNPACLVQKMRTWSTIVEESISATTDFTGAKVQAGYIVDISTGETSALSNAESVGDASNIAQAVLTQHDITNLPNELWLEVFEHLEYAELKNSARVDRLFRIFTQLPNFDKVLFRGCSVVDKERTVRIHPVLHEANCYSSNPTTSFATIGDFGRFNSDMTSLRKTYASGRNDQVSDPAITYLQFRGLSDAHKGRPFNNVSRGITLKDIMIPVTEDWRLTEWKLVAVCVDEGCTAGYFHECARPRRHETRLGLSIRLGPAMLEEEELVPNVQPVLSETVWPALPSTATS